jgi:hypothetical protein
VRRGHRARSRRRRGRRVRSRTAASSRWLTDRGEPACVECVLHVVAVLRDASRERVRPCVLGRLQVEAGRACLDVVVRPRLALDPGVVVIPPERDLGDAAAKHLSGDGVGGDGCSHAFDRVVRGRLDRLLASVLRAPCIALRLGFLEAEITEVWLHHIRRGVDLRREQGAVRGLAELERGRLLVRSSGEPRSVVRWRSLHLVERALRRHAGDARVILRVGHVRIESRRHSREPSARRRVLLRDDLGGAHGSPSSLRIEAQSDPCKRPIVGSTNAPHHWQ